MKEKRRLERKISKWTTFKKKKNLWSQLKEIKINKKSDRAKVEDESNKLAYEIIHHIFLL